jgi:CBS domain-containing protein
MEVVDENRRLLGVVTDRDIVVRGLAESKNVADIKVEDIMSDDVEAVTPDESIHDLIQLMGEKQIRRVPVVDRRDQLLGIISLSDLATRADYDEELQDALERISSKRSFWNNLFG